MLLGLGLGFPGGAVYSLGQMYHSCPSPRDSYPIRICHQSPGSHVAIVAFLPMGSYLEHHDLQQESIGLGRLPRTIHCGSKLYPGTWTGASTIAGTVRLQSMGKGNSNHSGCGDGSRPSQRGRGDLMILSLRIESRLFQFGLGGEEAQAIHRLRSYSTNTNVEFCRH
jgi:hypothetical protein